MIRHAHAPMSGDDPAPQPGKRLMVRVHERLRVKHYSLKTEQVYVFWIKQFLHHHDLRHPQTMGDQEVTAFLNHLATDRKVSAATQNLALAAILFLYRQVLGQQLPWLNDVIRAKRTRRVPVVLTQTEVRAILDQMTGIYQLIVSLLYGSGLRRSECLRLRVKDIDLDRHEITIRGGKGDRDRITMLGENVRTTLRLQLEHVAKAHTLAVKHGYAGVYLPNALSRKYPKAALEPGWQYVFPANRPSCDPRSGAYSHHVGQLLGASGHQMRRAPCGHHQISQLPYLSSFVCHASTRSRPGHSNRAGTARASQCQNHHDLHSCLEQRRPGRA